eukprot:SAG22_NODE_9954_length_561_cov_1.006494_1_plen_147_part_10
MRADEPLPIRFGWLAALVLGGFDATKAAQLTPPFLGASGNSGGGGGGGGGGGVGTALPDPVSSDDEDGQPVSAAVASPAVRAGGASAVCCCGRLHQLRLAGRRGDLRGQAGRGGSGSSKALLHAGEASSRRSSPRRPVVAAPDKSPF